MPDNCRLAFYRVKWLMIKLYNDTRRPVLTLTLGFILIFQVLTVAPLGLGLNISPREAFAQTSISNSSSYQVASTQAISYTIPSWIKNTAKWWSEGSVTDNDFIKGIRYLVQNGIISTQTQDQVQYVRIGPVMFYNCPSDSEMGL